MSEFRAYGEAPFNVVLVHGGPGAAGEMAPVAEKLSSHLGILEPFQTKHSISEQVEELKSIILKSAGPPVVLVGFSWGAWLSIIFASKFNELVGKLIIIGCAPLEHKYAPEVYKTRLDRLDSTDRNTLNSLLNELESGSITDTNSALHELGRIMSKADTYSSFVGSREELFIDADIYRDIWREAEDLRQSGELLKHIEKITCRVIAIHGAYDPHPSIAVIQPFLARSNSFRYHILPLCGHKPWIEQEAQDVFYKLLLEHVVLC